MTTAIKSRNSFRQVGGF